MVRSVRRARARTSSPLKTIEKPQFSSDDPIDISATKHTAVRPLPGTLAIFSMSHMAGGELATT